MTTLQAIVLGVAQGLSEFLPISSSAHLRVIPALFGWDDPGSAFTAVTQLGTLLAVILYFARDLARIGLAWLRSLFNPGLRREPDARLGWYILLGTLPIGVLGLLFERQIDTVARDLRLIAFTLIALGLLLWLADRQGSWGKGLADLSLRDGLLFGLAQALALIPGVSRSGATISAGLFLGYDRISAARYSFLLSVPAILASGLFKLADVSAGDGPGLWPTLLATLLAFASGYLSIAWLLRYVSTRSYRPFVLYRVALGALLALLLAAGALEPQSSARPPVPYSVEQKHPNSAS